MLPDAVVMSMGFAAPKSHADVSTMCNPPQAMLRLVVHSAYEGHE